MEYTDDGVDGVLGSDLNTFHPYLYWEPNERVSMWASEAWDGVKWMSKSRVGRTTSMTIFGCSLEA